MPILGTIIRAALPLLCGPAALACSAAVAVISSADVAGLTSGSLGQALRAGALAAVTFGAFHVAGQLASNLASGLSSTGPEAAWGPPSYLQQMPGIVIEGAPLENVPAAAATASGTSAAQSLAQGTINLVPGAYYSGLAQQKFWASNYRGCGICRGVLG